MDGLAGVGEQVDNEEALVMPRGNDEDGGVEGDSDIRMDEEDSVDRVGAPILLFPELGHLSPGWVEDVTLTLDL